MKRIFYEKYKRKYLNNNIHKIQNRMITIDLSKLPYHIDLMEYLKIYSRVGFHFYKSEV